MFVSLRSKFKLLLMCGFCNFVPACSCDGVGPLLLTCTHMPSTLYSECSVGGRTSHVLCLEQILCSRWQGHLPFLQIMNMIMYIMNTITFLYIIITHQSNNISYQQWGINKSAIYINKRSINQSMPFQN